MDVPKDPQRVRFAYRFLTWVPRLLVRLFFRRVSVAGLDNVPEKGGGIVVSWHPNALVDPGLILSYFPRRIVFGARHGLFRVPILGALMRAIGTVPVYRRSDDSAEDENARRERNQRSLDALARAVVSGSFAALFPEGVSHDEPHPLELKTGAARLYYRACELMDGRGPTPVIVPVGLHYDKKRVFDSNALVVFHPPIVLPDELLHSRSGDLRTEEALRERNRALTRTIEDALHHVVHATESWAIHNAMQRARKLVRAERSQRVGRNLGRPGMEERVLGFARLWAGYGSRLETHPDEIEVLTQRVQQYDAELLALGLEDHELDAPPAILNARFAVLALLQAFVVYLVLPPILLIGLVANLPAASLVWLLTKRAASAMKDEASLKVLIATVALPLNWLSLSLLAGWGGTALASLFPRISGAPLWTGITAFVLSAGGAYVALHYQRLAQQTARAFRVRITRLRRSKAVERLLRERSELCDQITELAEGLELPKTLTLDTHARDHG